MSIANIAARMEVLDCEFAHLEADRLLVEALLELAELDSLRRPEIERLTRAYERLPRSYK